MVEENTCSVYAIASLTRVYIYVGLTFDAERRIAQHQNGKERTTRPYRPFETLLIEHHVDRTAARAREK